jgi:hypothetical protein
MVLKLVLAQPLSLGYSVFGMIMEDIGIVMEILRMVMHKF